MFLLSPANCRGKRAHAILLPHASAPLAVALRSRRGAALGEVFAHVSGLYFRGKLTYARRFAAPSGSSPIVGSGVFVITPNAGLRDPDTRVTVAAVRAFAEEDVDPRNAAYRRPLETSARSLAREISPEYNVVLLGSVASPKYVEVLLGIFGERLIFPVDFVGRGDMSRGGLLLRCAASGEELNYAPVAGAVLHGMRPPKLPPIKNCRIAES